MANLTEFNEKLSIILNNHIIRIVISNPTTDAKFRKIEIDNKDDHFLISAYTEKQVFHKNIPQKELADFLHFKSKFNQTVLRQKNKFRDRKTHRYFTCPMCKAHLRVPKGKGKIEICCAKCRHKFIKRT